MSVRAGWDGEMWVEETQERSDDDLTAAAGTFGTAELLVTIVFALAVAAATLALVLSSA